MLESTPSNPQPEPASFNSALAAAAVLMGVALALLLGPWKFTSPVAPVSLVPQRFIDTTPVRRPRLQPIMEVAGRTYRCSDCHKNFKSDAMTTFAITLHRDISLRHGLNDRCFNCHNPVNRDAYVGDWGEDIPVDQPQRLCGKCHGTVYRDWLHGAHGRTNGYWDKSKGPQTRRVCIECHDPHAPSFAPLQPAPGPNTLRMGNQQFGPEEEVIFNPLHVYLHDQLKLAAHSNDEVRTH